MPSTPSSRIKILKVDQILELLGPFVNTLSRRTQRSKHALIEAALRGGYEDVLVAASITEEQNRMERHTASRNRRNTRRRIIRAENRTQSLHDDAEFLEGVSEDELKEIYRKFRDATGNAATRRCICGVCGRRQLKVEAGIEAHKLSTLPNVDVLRTASADDIPNAVEGLYLEKGGCRSEEGEIVVEVCRECYRELQRADEKPPKHSLANGLWIGEIPWQLRTLTMPEQLLIARIYPRVHVVKLFAKTCRGIDPSQLQSALQGNVTSFEHNMSRIADMVNGRLMPQDPRVLGEVLSVTYVGVGPLPTSWLKNTFRVRRRHVAEALQWLQSHNPKYYGDIEITQARLLSLPEDDIPLEILSTIQHESSGDVAELESSSYSSLEERDERK